MTVKLPQLTSRAVVFVLMMLVALGAYGCVNQTGVGVGTGTTARWGASTGRPPIFVGGPSL